jgi:hypothetical protein
MSRTLSQGQDFFVRLSHALLQSGEPDAYIFAGPGSTFRYAAPEQVEKVIQEYQLPPNWTAQDVLGLAFQHPDIQSNSAQLEYSDPFYVRANGAAVRITLRSANGGVYRLLFEVVDAVLIDTDIAARMKRLEAKVSELAIKVGNLAPAE